MFMFVIYKTPLCVAVEKNDIEIVKLLLKKDNIDVNVINIPSFYNF